MTVLVLGATGKTGRPLVNALAARGATVRAASRAPREGAGPEGVRFDWADRDTWEPALAGATALYLVGPQGVPDPVSPVRELLAAGKELRRVVLLSAVGAERLPAEIFPLTAWEEAVRESGAEWTVLRPNWFFQNFTEGAFVAALEQEGRIALPAAGARVGFIDTRDIAEVAALALTRPGYGGRVHELTGPQALDHAELAEILGTAAGRAVAYEPVSPEEYEKTLRGAGLPEESVTWLLNLFALMRTGGYDVTTDTVAALTGRQPRSFTSFATEHAARWRTPAQ
ncbi:SDR family oxidoreductase [Streptomyces sp. DSM 44917]|uniref:SDR family oxidoreductase n=1 Tax=Streptomyces boetiae TaxID=3075541 RepID=A0ABU2LBH3_9ACTN|nr:SDR family oxidoreductase [Streptomyces sp. DSM 44917]MDT0308927.1 SDR family oxidoreductase [Streptomyces sp. DSM 44917]